MGSVFISHAGADHAQVKFIHQALKKRGHRVRFSSDFLDGYEAGVDWAEQIEVEVKSFDLTVFWITKKWLSSPHCVGEYYVARQSLTQRRMMMIQAPDAPFPPVRRYHHRYTTNKPSDILQELEKRLAAVELKIDPGAPYPGLRPIYENETHLFFGREQLVRDMEARAWHRNKHDDQRRPLKVIVGPSGVGKTSLLRAGLFARCQAPTRASGAGDTAFAGAFDLTMPLEQSLIQALGVLAGEHAPARTNALQVLTQRVIDRFREPGATGVGARAILFVDGFERFYERENKHLRALVARVLRESRVNVVTSMRSDALPLLTDHDEELAPFATPISIAAIDEDTLPDLIVKPAERMGWKVDPGVTDEFVRFFSNNRNGLPLIAFALRQLWSVAQAEELARTGKVIHIGLLQRVASGERGAIASLVSDHCSALDEMLGADVDEPLQRILFRVCRWEPLTGVIRPHAISLASARTDELALAKQLCSEQFRLLSEGDTQPPTVRPAHDRILEIWPKARRLIEEMKPHLLLKAEVEQELLALMAEGRPGRLYFQSRSLEQLDDIQLMIETWSNELEPLIRSEWEAYRRSLSKADRIELANETMLRRQIDLPRASLSGLLAQSSADKSDWLLAAQFALSMGHLSTKGRRYKSIITPVIRSLHELREIEIYHLPETAHRGPSMYGGTLEAIPLRLSAFHGRDRITWTTPDAPPQHTSLLPDNHKAIHTLSGAGWGCVISVQDETGLERDRYRPKAMWIHHPTLTQPVRFNLGKRSFEDFALFAGLDGLAFAFVGSDASAPESRLLWMWRTTIRGLKTEATDVKFANLQAVCEVDFEVNALAISGAGPRVFVGGGRYDTTTRRATACGVTHLLRYHNTELGFEIMRSEPVDLPELQSSIASVAMSKDGDRLIVGDSGGRLFFHELKEAAGVAKTRLLRGVEPDVGIGVRRTHPGPVTSLAFSGNGTRAYSGSTSGEIKIWDAETGAQIGTLHGHRGRIQSLEVSSNGQFLASFGTDGTARLWDSRALGPIGRSAELADWPMAIAFTGPDELRAADSSGKLWRHQFRSSASPVLVGDAAINVTASTVIKTAGAPSGLLLAGDSAFAFFPNGAASLRRFDFAEGDRPMRISALTQLDDDHAIAAVLWRSGRTPETELMRIALSSGEIAATGAVIPAYISVLQTLSNGRIVCGRDDGTVSLWDPATGGFIDRSFSKSRRSRLLCVAEAVDLGVVLMAGSIVLGQNPIQVWDRDEWGSRHPREWIAGHQDQIHAMTVLPDGRTLASAGRDCMLRFWHIEGRIALGRIRAFPDWITALAVSPDSEIIATGGSRDRRVRTWGARPYHYAKVDWSNARGHYSDPAVSYVADVVAKLRPKGMPYTVLNQFGLGALSVDASRGDDMDTSEPNETVGDSSPSESGA